MLLVGWEGRVPYISGLMLLVGWTMKDRQVSLMLLLVGVQGRVSRCPSCCKWDGGVRVSRCPFYC